MKTKKIIVATLIVIAFAALWGCNKDATTGRLNVMMTDAPGDYDEVNIDVKGVEVHTDASGWVTLTNVNARTYNVLDLVNGKSVLIATADLPEGNVSQIRLILGDNNTVVEGGVSHPLEVPSGSESGLKINVHSDMENGEESTLLLDFDAGASVVAQGNGRFDLKPVIRAIDKEVTGSISGLLSLTAYTQIYVMSKGEMISTTADASGRFLLQGIPPGNYNLAIESSILANPIVVGNVNVTANETTALGSIGL